MKFQLIDFTADGCTTGMYIFTFRHGVAEENALFAIEHSDVLGFGICICFIWLRFFKPKNPFGL
jgi:hypothetical protein